jgi:hypothetical protein
MPFSASTSTREAGNPKSVNDGIRGVSIVSIGESTKESTGKEKDAADAGVTVTA